MVNRIGSLFASWKFSNFEIMIDRQYQVNVVWLNGDVHIHKVSWNFSNHQTDQKKLQQLGGNFQTLFYPYLHQYNDGSFAVTFYAKGLGGGNVCCKPSGDKEPLLQKQRQVQRQPPPVDSRPRVDLNVDLPALEQRLLRMGETAAKSFSEYADTYVPVVARNGDKEVDLEQEVYQFLSSQQKVFLLMGDAGSGKSLFLEQLSSKLGKLYKANQPIPLFISLPSLKNPIHRCIEEALEKNGFTREEIVYLKAYRRFVLFLDGYDETATDQNLIVTNRLNEWQCKVVMSCRSQYLAANYLEFFTPLVDGRPRPGLVREKTIAPFSSSQIEQYIKQRVAQGDTQWKNWEDCQRQIATIPGLAFLVKNPFVLTIVVQALPEVIERYAKLAMDEFTRLTRNELYRIFVQQWVDRQQKKLVDSQQIAPDVDMREKFRDFSTKLAQKMQAKGVYIVSYEEGGDLFDEAAEWKPFFGQGNAETVLIRSGCPLRKVGSQWSFIHATVLEFFASEKLFEAMQHLTVRMQEDERRPLVLQVLGNLNQRLLVNQRSIIQFAADRARIDPLFREVLFEIVYLSKTSEEVSIAAANAITILCKAGVPFSGKDFSGIRVPDADLTGAILDGTLCVKADFRRVCLENAFLKETNFSGALMQGIKLKQRSFLIVPGEARCCTVSPHNKWLAVASQRELNNKGKGFQCAVSIEIFDKTTLEHVRTLAVDFHLRAMGGAKGHLAFSPDGRFLAISSGNESEISDPGRNYAVSINVYDCQTWNHRLLTLDSHDSSDYKYAGLSFVFISPNQIVSSTFLLEHYQQTRFAKNRGIGIWDVASGKLVKTYDKEMKFHTVSPNGQFIIATLKEGGRVIVKASNLSVVRKIEGNYHTFSPDSRVLAYVHEKILFIYDMAAAKIVKQIPNFGDGCSLIFSPDGERLAASIDTMISVWSLPQEKEISRFRQHKGNATDIRFSEDGTLVFSTAYDDPTVRIKEIGDIESAPVEKIELSCISSFQNEGIIVGINAQDKTELLWWSVETGELQSVWRPLNKKDWWLSIAIASKKDILVAAGFIDRKNVLVTFDLKTRAILNTTPIATPQYFNSLAITQDGTFCAASHFIGESRGILVWNLVTQAIEHEFSLKTKLIGAHHLSFSPNGRFLAIASSGTGPGNDFYKFFVQVFDVSAGAMIEEIAVHSIRAVFSQDNKFLIFADKEHEICFYNLQTRQVQQRLKGHTNFVSALTISEDGYFLASGDCLGKIHLWDLKSGRLVTGFFGHHQWVLSLNFTSHDRRLISYSRDMIMHVWDLYNFDNNLPQASAGKVQGFEPTERKGQDFEQADPLSALSASQELEVLNPRLRWASNPQFYARKVRVDNVQGLAKADEQVLKQVDTSVDLSWRRACLTGWFM